MDPLVNGFMYVVWFFATYYIVFFCLVLFSHKDDLYERKYLPKGVQPKVSIIVPAYNEETKITYTIRSLQKVSYPHVEFIIINDGSKDATSAVVKQAIKGDSRFRFIDRKENRGKAASLNQGIAASTGEFIACMDADSVVERDIFQKTLPYIFEDEKIGAVTVSVAVSKPKNLLHRIVQIEYIVGLSLFLKVFSTFNCVFVTPGPFSIYRKTALQKIGGFDEKSMTEDLEIAYRLHKAHFRITSCLDATVKTIVPPTFIDVYKQRRRWYTGAMQTVYKHRSMLFSDKYGMFGYFLPFNFGLIAAGLMLFFMTTYLAVRSSIKVLLSYQYTGFNLLDRLRQWRFDLLATKQVELIGYVAFAAAIIIMLISMRVTKSKFSDKKTGMIAYPLLFFLYQLWWIGAIITLIRGKKISWR